MITAISTKEREYILKSDRDSEIPTVWIIKSLTRRESSAVQDNAPAKNGKAPQENSSDITDKYLEKVLLGWKNFKDAEGKEVVFSKENFCMFNWEVANELFTEITGIVLDAKAKNSEG